MKKKILVIGGTGTIGKVVTNHLLQHHEVITAGKTNGDFQVDISNTESIKSLLESIGLLDAIICIAGEAKWAPFEELSEEDYFIGINNKLMGQVNLVRVGIHYLNDGGSITLTTGILGERPVPMTASAAMVNGAIHSFVKAVVLDLKENIRINVIASGLVEDAAEKYAEFFPGHKIIPMDKVAMAYENSILGTMNGEIIRIYE